MVSVSVAVQNPPPQTPNPNPNTSSPRVHSRIAAVWRPRNFPGLYWTSLALRLASCVASYFGNGVPRPAAAHIARRQRRARAYPRLEAGAERAGAVYPCGARQRRDGWVSVVECRREILTPRSIDADGD